MDGETVRTNGGHEDGYKYDVALSYASEQRDIVRRVWKILKEEGFQVFYDEASGEELIAQDLYTKLYHIFRYDSRYVVAFISEDYLRKDWTIEEAGTMMMDSYSPRNRFIPRRRVIPICFGAADLSDLDPDIYRIHADGKASVWIAEQIRVIISKSYTTQTTSMPLSIQEIVKGELSDFGIHDRSVSSLIHSLFGPPPLQTDCEIDDGEIMFLCRDLSSWTGVIRQGTIITDRGIYCKENKDKPVFTTWEKFVRCKIEERVRRPMVDRSVRFVLSFIEIPCFLVSILFLLLLTFPILLAILLFAGDLIAEISIDIIGEILIDLNIDFNDNSTMLGMVVAAFLSYTSYSLLNNLKKAWSHSYYRFYLTNGSIVSISSKKDADKTRRFLTELQSELCQAGFQWDPWTTKKLNQKKAP